MQHHCIKEKRKEMTWLVHAQDCWKSGLDDAGLDARAEPCASTSAAAETEDACHNRGVKRELFTQSEHDQHTHRMNSRQTQSCCGPITRCDTPTDTFCTTQQPAGSSWR
jgi:hypothetical protein